MPSSDSSSLSSALSSDNEVISRTARKGTLDGYLNNNGAVAAASPPKKQRPASPPHEYVLADNPDIAVIVMFRSRFSDAFPKSLPHYGPQDIERGVAEPILEEHLERLLCALLGLVLNRKKDIERGHFSRALEESVLTHSNQWPSLWNGKNPLHGGGNFSKMSPAQRLTLLKTLCIWSLGSSEAVQAILKESYKQQRHDDDLNQPLSVQPWGRDGDKRRYWLIEGQDDTHFRLYRESNPALKHTTWWGLAGTIDELNGVAGKLGEDGSQASRRLKDRITLAIPRFEASEEKRKRRDYRNQRKAQFVRPEPGFSLYEGRTRGKRIRYTYSDDDEGVSDGTSNRRSNRASGISTPADSGAPTFTASGRQVKSRVGGAYGEIMLSGPADVHGDQEPMHDANNALDLNQSLPTGRPQRSTPGKKNTGKPKGREHIAGYNALDEMEDESDATSSEEDWDGGDDDEGDEHLADEDEEDDVEMSEEGISDDDEVGYERGKKKSLIVSLRIQDRHRPSDIGMDKKLPATGTNGTICAPTFASIETDRTTDNNEHNDMMLHDQTENKGIAVQDISELHPDSASPAYTEVPEL